MPPELHYVCTASDCLPPTKVDPWAGRFEGARLVEQVTVVADDPSGSDRVRLSKLDTGVVIMSSVPTFVFVFEKGLDFARLHLAARALLIRYPVFAGR